MAYDATSGLRQMVYSVNIPNSVKISKYVTGFGEASVRDLCAVRAMCVFSSSG